MVSEARPVYSHAWSIGALPVAMRTLATMLDVRGLPWSVWYRDGWRASVAGVYGGKGWHEADALRMAVEKHLG